LSLARRPGGKARGGRIVTYATNEQRSHWGWIDELNRSGSLWSGTRAHLITPDRVQRAEAQAAQGAKPNEYWWYSEVEQRSDATRIGSLAMGGVVRCALVPRQVGCDPSGRRYPASLARREERSIPGVRDRRATQPAASGSSAADQNQPVGELVLRSKKHDPGSRVSIAARKQQ